MPGQTESYLRETWWEENCCRSWSAGTDTELSRHGGSSGTLLRGDRCTAALAHIRSRLLLQALTEAFPRCQKSVSSVSTLSPTASVVRAPAAFPQRQPLCSCACGRTSGSSAPAAAPSAPGRGWWGWRCPRPRCHQGLWKLVMRPRNTYGSRCPGAERSAARCSPPSAGWFNCRGCAGVSCLGLLGLGPSENILPSLEHLIHPFLSRDLASLRTCTFLSHVWNKALEPLQQTGSGRTNSRFYSVCDARLDKMFEVSASLGEFPLWLNSKTEQVWLNTEPY